jgi:DNA-3-methyladenine glycosylase
VIESIQEESVVKLEQSFYRRPTLEVAKDLLGRVLVRRSPQGACAGIIVETEAYIQGDPACHASRGQTRRNASMFAPGGCGYVYQIYGIHYCFNIVSGQADVGEAVLIRALEPLAGIPLMQERRGTQDLKLLCSGPGRLCQALAITTAQDGIDLLGDEIFLLAGQAATQVITTTRIGISQGKELPYRFYIADNPYVSRR